MKIDPRHLLFGLVAVALCANPRSSAATATVTITDFSFAPNPVTINVGDTVRWVHQAGAFVQHTSTSGTTAGGLPQPDGLWNSGFLSQGQSFSHTFTNAGTFPYYCAVHYLTMTASVIVLGAGNEPPTLSITSPNNNASFPAGTALTVEANATDPDGTVTQVEFFDGASSLGVDGTDPYSVGATLTPGDHTLTAVATDNQNEKTTSAAIKVTVNGVPIADPIAERIPKGEVTVELVTVLDGLPSPLGLAVPDDGSGRMFVYDQTGLAWVLANGSTQLATPLLDVRSRLVALGAYDERGLLGLAVHPQFAQNPLVYTYTSEPNAGAADFPADMPPGTVNDHQSVLTEWRIDPGNTNQIDPAWRREILRIDKPQANHNGGAIHFGPDGFLYIALGDGGDANDVGDGHMPGGNAQDVNMILGKLLRIDVDGTNSANGRYGLPAGNPFVGQDGLDEVYAYGLRNPFSFSFDSVSGQLYLGDVGQNKIEEVDLIVSGGNYGWNVKEGSFWFESSTGNLVTTPVRPVPAGLIDPIAQYDHDDGTVVIGGFVYHGTLIPALQGRYVFADWGTFDGPSGKLLYLDSSNTVQQLRVGVEDRPLGAWVKGMGEGPDGELYVLSTRVLGPSGNTGRMLRIVPAPEPLAIAGAQNQGGTNFASQSTGGTGPFVLQMKPALTDPTWMNVDIDPGPEVSTPFAGEAGFFRVLDIAHQPPIPLTLVLSGAFEHPSLANSATGSGTLSLDGNTLTFNIRYSGLSGTAQAAHIHGPAPASTNAGVMLNLAPYHVGAFSTSGVFSGVVLLRPDQQAALLASRTYVNIHTLANPLGETRGQIAPVLMQVALNGAHQRPEPVATDSTGLGTLALVGDQLTLNLAYQGLSGPAVAAHIHGPAPASANADVLVNLAPLNGGGFGTSGSLAGTVTLAPDVLAALVDGLTYINVHTSAHSGGEIRGQVLPQSAGIPLSASLSGEAERPTAVTNTAGTATALFSLEGNTLLIDLTYSNLSAPAVAMHIHGPASTDEATGIMVNLAPFHVGPFATNGAVSGSVQLTPTQRTWVLGAQTYVNIHTTTHASGEIRGQIAPVLMMSTLGGAQERPTPVVTPGNGSGTLTLVGNHLSFNVTYRDLSSTATLSHIHGPASVFAAAGVLQDLGTFNGGAWGTSGSLAGAVTLNATNLGRVIDGQTYINVHSTTVGSGEIRGQITR